MPLGPRTAADRPLRGHPRRRYRRHRQSLRRGVHSGAAAPVRAAGMAALRSGAWTAAALPALPPRAGGPRLRPDHAPHRLRRLVHDRLPARDLGGLQRVLRRPALAAAGAADPVPRLRRLAAAAPERRGSRRRALLVARAAGRRAGARAAHRPAAAARPEPSRRGVAADARSRGHGPPARARQPAGGDAVHGPAGSLAGAAPPLQRPGRFRGGDPGGQPRPLRGRGPDRILRQHPGAAHPPGGRYRLPRAPRPGAPGGRRGLRPRRAAVREARRASPARAVGGPQPARPGVLHDADPVVAGPPPRRCPALPDGSRHRNLQVRAEPGLDREQGVLPRRPQLQHQPVRPGHRRTHAAPLRDAGRLRAGRSLPECDGALSSTTPSAARSSPRRPDLPSIRRPAGASTTASRSTRRVLPRLPRWRT